MKGSTALILILVSIALFYTFISPEWDKVKAQQATASQYNEVLENVSKLITTRDALEEKYRAIPQAEIDKLGKILPDNLDSVKLALDLDTIASRYGITIKEIQVVNPNDSSNQPGIVVPETGRPYESAKVSFVFVSSYENFRRFMHDVEISDRISNVKEISFQSTDNNLNEYRVILEIYWVK